MNQNTIEYPAKSLMRISIPAFLLISIGFSVCCVASCSPKPKITQNVLYEYDIEAEHFLAPSPGDLLAAINKKAKDGWRLIFIDRHVDRMNGSVGDTRRSETMAISLETQGSALYFFERAVNK